MARHLRKVEVRDCYWHTFDDLVVIKTNEPAEGEPSGIRVKQCVLWNDLARHGK